MLARFLIMSLPAVDCSMLLLLQRELELLGHHWHGGVSMVLMGKPLDVTGFFLMPVPQHLSTRFIALSGNYMTIDSVSNVAEVTAWLCERCYLSLN